MPASNNPNEPFEPYVRKTYKSDYHLKSAEFSVQVSLDKWLKCQFSSGFVRLVSISKGLLIIPFILERPSPDMANFRQKLVDH